MNIAFLCIILAAFMPILLAGVAKSGGHAAGLRYSNARPRETLSRLEGWPQRANWAQQNSWEALPIFAAAVLMASHAQVPQAMIEFWALVFIAARVVYALLYIINRPSLRSLVWCLGLFACFRLMFAAI